jgi:hypothetical protein
MSPWLFTKWRPSNSRWRAQIRLCEGVSDLLISGADLATEGSGSFYYLWLGLRRTEHRGTMAGGKESSSALSWAPKPNPILPTCYRQRGETVLLSFGNGNGQRRGGDGGVVQSNLGDGEGGLR